MDTGWYERGAMLESEFREKAKAVGENPKKRHLGARKDTRATPEESGRKKEEKGRECKTPTKTVGRASGYSHLRQTKKEKIQAM